MVTFASAPRQWSRGLWDYYRGYTRRRVAVHAAATAALTGFGLLATYNRLFVGVAIAAYVLPPVYLYATGDEFKSDRASPTDGDTADRKPKPRTADSDADTPDTDGDLDSADADTDTDSDGADADADGADTDTDTDGTDADSDGADVDADADG